MGDRSRRATYTPGMEYDSSKRGTVSERPAGKADRARASTLLALGLADEKEQALTEASLLSADVEDTEAITSGSYKVLILGTDLAAKKAGKAFTVYKVEITHDISAWIIYRRYSQFHALMEDLKSVHGKKITKGFPPKKFVHNLSPASIDRRHQQLQDWLQTVLNDKWVVSETALQLFIKAGKEDADFVPRQHASTIESDIDMATTLHKYDGGKWKSRWFVLRHGRLYKYNSPQSKHPYGFYDIRECKAVPLAEVSDLTIKNARQYCFIVDAYHQQAQKQKRYIFAADTEAIMKGWISCANQEFSVPLSDKVFGVPIANVRDRDDNGVPLFLSALLTFLEATALDQEDLFTKPPDEEIKRAIDRGKTVDLAKVAEDAHAVAGLIVQYLHELPDAIIPEDLCPTFYGIFQINDEKKRLRMLAALSEILPIINRNLLIKLFSFLQHASQGAVKRSRLSKIFGRIIFRIAGEHQINLTAIAEQLMDHWDTLVVADEVYAAPEKILVVKKKKVKGSTTGNGDGKPTEAVKPVHNDYYDSNEEFEESSEEEEWTDEEVQVISEISEDYTSEEEYDEDEESEEEEEYSEDDLLQGLSKAAADIPDIEPSATTTTTSTATPRSVDSEVTKDTTGEAPATPSKKDKKKAEKEAAKAAAAAAEAAAEEAKAAAETPAEIPPAKESSKKSKKDAPLAASSDEVTGTKSKKELRAAEKAAKAAAEAEAADSNAKPVEESAEIPATAAEPTAESTDTPTKKHKRDRTTDKSADKAAADKPASEKKSSKKDKTEIAEQTAETSATSSSADKPASSKKKSRKDDDATTGAATTAEVTEAAPKSSPKSTKKVKKANSKRTKREPSVRPTQIEVVAGVQTGVTPTLSLEGVEHEDSPLGSPSHRPLASPIAHRPKKHTTHSPSAARSPNEPATRTITTEPQRTPQEQLVADLFRVLGRRMPGGAAAPTNAAAKRAAANAAASADEAN